MEINKSELHQEVPKSRGKRRNRAFQQQQKSVRSEQNLEEDQHIEKIFQKNEVEIIDLGNNQSFCQDQQQEQNYSGSIHFSQEQEEENKSGENHTQEYNIQVEEAPSSSSQNIDHSCNIEYSNVQLQSNNNIQDLNELSHTNLTVGPQITEKNTSSVLLKLPLQQQEQQQQEQYNTDNLGETFQNNNTKPNFTLVTTHNNNTLGTHVDLDQDKKLVESKKGSLTEIEMKENKINRTIRYTLYVLIITFLIASLGFVTYLVLNNQYVKEGDENTCIGKFRDQGKGCQCIQGYYDKGDSVHCVGPFQEDYSIEDISISLKGQEDNFVTRVFKKQQVQYYQYNIENVQYNNIDGVLYRNSSNMEYNLGIFTKNVTDSAVNCVFFVQNSTSEYGEKKDFIEGYPKSFEEDQENDNENYLDGELLDSIKLNSYQKEKMSSYNITKEEYIMSQMPILEVSINKQGEIKEIFYPINLPQNIKDIIPNVLNQYSPPLEQSSFTEIDEIKGENGKRRRILSQNPVKNVSEPGQFSENSNLSYSADIDSDVNQAEIFKQYSQENDHKGGKSVQQKSSLNQKTNIQDGIVKEATAQGSMDLKNPENNNNISEDDDGEMGGALMSDVKVEQFVSFTFMYQNIVEESFSEKILRDFSKNFREKLSFREFQEQIILEKDLLGKEINEKNNDNDGENDGNDGEQLEQEIEIIDDEQEEKRRNLGSGDYIIRPIEKSIFRFSLLGLKVSSSLSFHCVESPQGEEKDVCEFKPQFRFGKHRFTYKSFKFKVPLSKMVKRFNWYRSQILGIIEEVKAVLSGKINEIQQNSGEVIDAVDVALDVGQSQLALGLEGVNDQFRVDVEGKYAQFQQNLDELLGKQKRILEVPVGKGKGDVEGFLKGYFEKIWGVWDDLEETFGGNLDEIQEEIENGSGICQEKFDVIQGIQKEFESFSDEFMENLKENVQNLAEKNIFQPLFQFFLNLQPKEKEVEDEYKESHNKFNNMMNSMLTDLVQGELNSFTEETKEKIGLFSDLTKEKIAEIKAKLDEKFANLKRVSQSKVNNSMEESNEEMEAFYGKISLSGYLQYEDLYFQEIEEFSVFDEEFLKYFELVFDESQKEKQNMENAFFWFNQLFQRNFMENVEEMSEKLKKMSENLNETVYNTRNVIESRIEDIIEAGKTIIPELKEAIKLGNMENQELDSSLDIESIQDQVDGILDMNLEIDKADEIIQKSKGVPEKFEAILEFIKQKTVENWEHFKQIQVGLKEVSDFDVQDLNVGLFQELFEAKKEVIQEQIEKEVKEEIQEQYIGDFNSHIEKQSQLMQKSMKKMVFEEIFDFDSMFRDELMKILDKFRIEKKRILNLRLMNKSYGVQTLILTPLGVPFYLNFQLKARLNAMLDLEVKGRNIGLSAAFQLESEASAEGGFDIVVLKVGAYVSAVLFNGYLIFNVLVGFQEKLKGSVELQFKLMPFLNRMGLFYQKRTIKFVRKCVNLYFFKLCIPWPSFVWGRKRDLIKPFIVQTFIERTWTLFKKNF